MDEPIRNFADILGGNVAGILYCSLIANKHFEAACTTSSTVNSRNVKISSDISLERKKYVNKILALKRISHYNFLHIKYNSIKIQYNPVNILVQ